MSGPAERGQNDIQGTSEAEFLRRLGGSTRSFTGVPSLRQGRAGPLPTPRGNAVGDALPEGGVRLAEV